jgi:hypothetical protein
MTALNELRLRHHKLVLFLRHNRVLIGCLRMKVEEQADYKIRHHMRGSGVRNPAKEAPGGYTIRRRSWVCCSPGMKARGVDWNSLHDPELKNIRAAPPRQTAAGH